MLSTTVSGNPHLGPLGPQGFRSDFPGHSCMKPRQSWADLVDEVPSTGGCFLPKNRGVSPKMDGLYNGKFENPFKMDDLGETHHFWKHPGVFFWKFPVDLALLVHNFLGGDVSK